MFGIAGRKSRSQLVRQELGQSVEHFRQAATHAARGTGATVGPKIDAARDRVQPAAIRAKDAASSSWDGALAALAPLTVAVGDKNRKTGKDARKAKNKNMMKLQKKTNKALKRKQSGSRTGKLAGLLAAGVAVGAAAAYLAKRRQPQQWDEYDPSRPIDAAEQAKGTDDVAFEPADSAGTSTFTTPSSYSSSVYGEPIEPAVDPTVDQTSSKLR